jgi:hypothetical protein
LFTDITGLQGDLQHDLAEIGWGNLFMTTSRMRIMDFTDWYLHDPSCFVYKRPSPYAGIFSLVFPLENETWLFIAVLIAAVNLFFLLYTAVWKDRYVTIGRLVMYEASATFKVSHELTYSLPTFTLR